MSGDWIKVTAEKAIDVCADIDLPDEAKALLKPAFTPGAYFITLRNENQRDGALMLLARALPAYDAIAWACACVSSTLKPESTEQEREAVALASKWVDDPNEANARAAYALAEALEFQTGPAWTAAAPLWAGENMAPEGNPPVAPAAHLPARAVFGAVAIAASTMPNMDESKDQFLDMGAAIAAGQTPQMA
jgi:hypothetical protein